MALIRRHNHCGTMEDDIISHLSDNVVDNILMFLPLRDAVRTSALSQKWRHNWETLPQLVFDSDFEESLKQYPAKNELLFTIYQILLLHRGPILKFTLSISGSKSFCAIDPIVWLLSRNGIQNLLLALKGMKNIKCHRVFFRARTKTFATVFLFFQPSCYFRRI